MAGRTVLIIGAGFGGLLLARKLTGRGVGVTLVDKNGAAGGGSGTVRVGGAWHPRVCYSMLGLEPGGGVSEAIWPGGRGAGQRPRRLPIADHVFFPDFDLELPANVHGFAVALEREFPAQRRAVREYLRVIEDVYGTARTMQAAGARSRQAAAQRLIEYQNAGYEAMLRRMCDDPKLIGVLSARAFSSTNTVLTMGAYVGKILNDGLYGLHGSASTVAALLQNALARDGGCRLMLRTEVVEVLFDEAHQAVGARLRDGSCIAADHVVVGTEPGNAARMLIRDRTVRAAVQRSLAAGERALSAVVILYVLDPSAEPVLRRYEACGRLFYCETYGVFDALRSRETGAFDARMFKINLDHDPSSGCRRVYVEIDCAAGGAAPSALSAQSALANEVLGKLERVLPGISRHVVDRTVTIPAAFAACTGSADGATGWKDGGRRPAGLHSELGRWNLLSVGQWAGYGAGLSQMEASAERALREIRRRRGLGRGPRLRAGGAEMSAPQRSRGNAAGGARS